MSAPAMVFYEIYRADETVYRRSVSIENQRSPQIRRFRHGEPPPQKPSGTPSGSSPSGPTTTTVYGVSSEQTFIIAYDWLHDHPITA